MQVVGKEILSRGMANLSTVEDKVESMAKTKIRLKAYQHKDLDEVHTIYVAFVFDHRISFILFLEA